MNEVFCEKRVVLDLGQKAIAARALLRDSFAPWDLYTTRIVGADSRPLHSLDQKTAKSTERSRPTDQRVARYSGGSPTFAEKVGPESAFPARTRGHKFGRVA